MILQVLIALSIHFYTCTSESEHRTKAASEKLSDLYCYRCDSLVQKDTCYNVTNNSTSIQAKCSNDQRICQVTTITMSSSTENGTGQPKMWLLRRNCTKVCEPVCVNIGERTKLRSCTTCCETSFCNSGSSADLPHLSLNQLNSVVILLAFCIINLYHRRV